MKQAMSARQGLLLALLAVVGLFLSGTDTTLSVGNFTPANTVKLCAYTDVDLGTPCTVEDLTPGSNADITTVLTIPSGQLNAGLVAAFTAPAAVVPGPETGALCDNAVDDDGDTVVNDGCPPVAPGSEVNRCDNQTNDDVADDAIAGPARANDGCPQFGPAPESGADCDNFLDDDGDTKINDGCYPGGVGGAEAENGGWCENAIDDDPRDDAAGGAQKVNDGCPQEGAAAETGADCDNAVDDDSDTKVNDGCYPGGFGGVEAEVNECDNSADDDADGYVNDGCPGVGDLPLGAVVGKGSPGHEDGPQQQSLQQHPDVGLLLDERH